jgi:hypothetical protein
MPAVVLGVDDQALVGAVPMVLLALTAWALCWGRVLVVRDVGGCGFGLGSHLGYSFLFLRLRGFGHVQMMNEVKGMGCSKGKDRRSSANQFICLSSRHEEKGQSHCMRQRKIRYRYQRKKIASSELIQSRLPC